MKLLPLLIESDRIVDYKNVIDNKEKLKKIAPYLERYLKKKGKIHIKKTEKYEQFDFYVWVGNVSIIENKYLQLFLQQHLSAYKYLLNIKLEQINGTFTTRDYEGDDDNDVIELSIAHFPSVCEDAFTSTFAQYFDLHKWEINLEHY